MRVFYPQSIRMSNERIHFHPTKFEAAHGVHGRLENQQVILTSAAIHLNEIGVSLLENRKFKRACITLGHALAIWRVADRCDVEEPSFIQAAIADAHSKIRKAQEAVHESSEGHSPVSLPFHVKASPSFPVESSDDYWCTKEMCRQHNDLSSSQPFGHTQHGVPHPFVAAVFHPVTIITGDQEGSGETETNNVDVGFCSAILLFNVGISFSCLSICSKKKKTELEQKANAFFNLSLITLQKRIAVQVSPLWCSKSESVVSLGLPALLSLHKLLKLKLLVLHSMAWLWQSDKMKEVALRALLKRLDRTMSFIDQIELLQLVTKSNSRANLAPAA